MVDAALLVAAALVALSPIALGIIILAQTARARVRGDGE